MSKPSRNSPCPCGSGKKWKRCHGRQETPLANGAQTGRSLAFDPMASLLEQMVRPRLLSMRQAAVRVWATTLDAWVEDEQQLHGFDTERLERLIERAWRMCTNIICKWDARFALQALRSLPAEVVEAVTQLYNDSYGLVTVMRITTAAAVTSNSEQWDKGEREQYNCIMLSPEQLSVISEQSPDILGGCIGAANLVYAAQGWYRWAGKGKRILHMPKRLRPQDIKAIERWNGEGFLLLSAVEMSSDTTIEKSVYSYESRRDAALEGGLRSGMLHDKQKHFDHVSSQSMWFVGWRGTDNPALPVHVPGLDYTFPSPNWYPILDQRLPSWIEQLRPFEDVLKLRLGMSCDELFAGLQALGLVVARQTQCCYLKLGKWAGRDALSLESPAKGKYLHDAVEHLVSVLLRGTLRTSVAKFRTAIQMELVLLKWPHPMQLGATFLSALTGSPKPNGLLSPFLFYVIDPLTCVLDLSLWDDFTDACLAVATSGDGDVGNLRGRLFERQVRNFVTKELNLTEGELPWPANCEIWDGDINRGDVDFCFIRHNILFNLDMKSWQRSSDYHVGHYHTIRDRLVTLETQIAQLERRGTALQQQLEWRGSQFVRRLDFIIVAAPEYLALDRISLWYKNQPRVITVDELLRFVREVERVSHI